MAPLTIPYPPTNTPAHSVVVDGDKLEANFQAIIDWASGQIGADNLAAGLLAAVVQPGALQMIAYDVADTGWLLCDGAAVSRTTYSALFGKIGTKYGTGDGSTTFNLPDFRGRVPSGKGTAVDVDTLGKSDGLAVGSRKPKHQHAGSTSTTGSHSHGGNTGGESSSHVHVASDGFLVFTSGGGKTWQPNLVFTSGNFDVVPFTSFNQSGHFHGIGADGNHSHSVTLGDTGGPTDTPGFQVVNFQVKT